MSQEIQLPDHPSARRLIVGLNDVDYDQLYMDANRELFARGDIALVNAEASARQAQGLLNRLVDRGLLRPGRVLVQSPYRFDDYADAEVASEAFAMDKVTRMSTLAGLLGAKSLRLTSVTEENTKSRWDASAEASGGLAGRGSVKANQSQAAVFARKIKFEDTFTGGEPDVEGAQRHLMSCNLDGDRELQSLVEARSVSTNKHVKRTFSVDLSSEASSRLDIAGEVSKLLFAKGKVNFNMNTFSRAVYRVEYTITY